MRDIRRSDDEVSHDISDARCISLILDAFSRLRATTRSIALHHAVAAYCLGHYILNTGGISLVAGTSFHTRQKHTNGRCRAARRRSCAVFGIHAHVLIDIPPCPSCRRRDSRPYRRAWTPAGAFLDDGSSMSIMGRPPRCSRRFAPRRIAASSPGLRLRYRKCGAGDAVKLTRAP